jgi:hypothetical protein
MGMLRGIGREGEGLEIAYIILIVVCKYCTLIITDRDLRKNSNKQNNYYIHMHRCVSQILLTIIAIIIHGNIQRDREGAYLLTFILIIVCKCCTLA